MTCDLLKTLRTNYKQTTFHELDPPPPKKNKGLYFAAPSSIMCKISTPNMISETYKELATKGVNDIPISKLAID